MRVFISLLLWAVSASGETCLSRVASYIGGWKPVATAPRDGTLVEMLETYGFAPWYGVFMWTRVMNTEPKEFIMKDPRWVQVNEKNLSVVENECLYWRPYRPTGKKYVDPTNGAQNTIAYECAWMKLKYNAKKDACER